MEKYKICPNCKEKNPPDLLECLNCETDLTSVKITDEETEQGAEKTNGTEVKKQPKTSGKENFVRICDCGFKNTPRTRKCKGCGEDISDVAPTPDREEKPVCYILSSLDGKLAYKVKAGETVIGRSEEMAEYLHAKSYVSRVHAKLTLTDNELYIENLSGVNFTYVNNEKISGRVKLSRGDEIGLGGLVINGSRQELAAYFTVITE